MVTAFFNAKGLVRQQLDSFNEFINSNMQEIVDEHGTLVIKPESQHNPGVPSRFSALQGHFDAFIQVGKRRKEGVFHSLAGKGGFKIEEQGSKSVVQGTCYHLLIVLHFRPVLP